MPWGIAEEAGKAARWLTARGLPGVELLADLLTGNDKRIHAELAPADVDGVWQAPAGRLCPLIAGAALSDRAAEIADGRTIELGATTQPLLLAPYAASAAKLTGTAITLGWDGVVMTLTPAGEIIEGNRSALTTGNADSVQCQRLHDRTAPAAPLNKPAAAVNEPAAPADAAWSRLVAFAQRTLAPATEASRLSGAGAGQSDNI